jgi:hypothetical protein
MRSAGNVFLAGTAFRSWWKPGQRAHHLLSGTRCPGRFCKAVLNLIRPNYSLQISMRGDLKYWMDFFLCPYWGYGAIVLFTQRKPV